MADSIPVRLATAGDVGALVSLRAAFLAEVAGADQSDERLLDALRGYFREAVPAGELVAYVAEAAGEVVATGGLVFHQHPPSARNPGGREGYIMNMYTVPPWRGRGLGSRVLHLLVGHARRSGCGRVSLHALPKGRPLYAKAGFAAVDTEMRLTLDDV